MQLHHYRNWGLEYLVIAPEQWRREGETNGWLRGYEVLDLRHAKIVLEAMLREDPYFVRELHDRLLTCPWSWLTNPSSEHDQQRHQALRDMLGSVFSKPGEPPHLARLYICRSKPVPRKPPPDPWKETREALEAARKAPRGYVIAELVTDAGVPVPGVRLEVLLADGDVRTLHTDTDGKASADLIPQGRCHIRLPDLDGSSWWPADRSQSSPVDQAAKRTHIVAQGECLARIAARYAINDWRRIWDAPENQKLRAKRKSPNVLLPGDQVVVPGRKVHEVVKPTDQTHRLVIANAATIELVTVFRNEDGRTLDGESYELTHVGLGPDGKKTGNLDSSGTLTEQIPVTVSHVEVDFAQLGERYRIAVSHLDPLEHEPEQFLERSAEDRLAALGYLARRAGDARVTDPKAALRAFQSQVMGRTGPTGELDAETCQKLEELYGA